MTTSITLCDGKYTVICDSSIGRFEALRYGEKWQDLCGNNLVLAMFDEIVDLREQLETEKGKF